jgi:hypothetical protein
MKAFDSPNPSPQTRYQVTAIAIMIRPGIISVGSFLKV